MIPRRVAFLGLAAVLLAGAGIAAAATHEDDDKDTPAALEQLDPTTTTTAFVDTTTTAAAVTTSTTPATSTTAAGATTTTRRGATTTTTRPGATTTTTRPIAACTTAQIEPRVTTDKPSYGIGEPVKIHSTLHNRSASTCTYPSFVFTATITGPNGQTVTGFDRVGETPSGLGTGQALEAYVDWVRVACTSNICPPNVTGPYIVSATWHFPGGPYTDTETIQLN